MNLNLKDKVVIVTGGGAGIGRATAEAFEREGATAIVWDVSSEPRIDVTNRESVESAVAAVMAEHGRIDVLINNAGVLRGAQLVKFKDGEITGVMEEAAFDTVKNGNLRAGFICTRAVGPHMNKAGRGVVLNVSSILG